jgi:hypothetical protein
MDTFDAGDFDQDDFLDPRISDESLSPLLNPPAIAMDIQILQVGSAVILKSRGRTALIRHDTSQVCPDLWDESDLWKVSAWEPGIDNDLIPMCSANYAEAMSAALMALRAEVDPADWQS